MHIDANILKIILNPTMWKKFLHHNQVGFLPVMQVWFNIPEAMQSIISQAKK